MLLVCLAAIATSSISTGVARLTSFIVGAVSSFVVALLSAFSIITQDLSGMSRELETATGIAATHGITGLQITTQPMAAVSIGVFLILSLTFGRTSISSKNWKSKPSQANRQGQKPLKDSISLWDEQR